MQPTRLSRYAADLLTLIKERGGHDFTNDARFSIWAWRECEAQDLVKNLGGMRAEITAKGHAAMQAAALIPAA